MTDRECRIEAFTVDRSAVRRVPLWPLSAEAQKYEPRLVDIRASATRQDKLDAWRRIEQAAKFCAYRERTRA